jgi:hypothetical protein
VKPSKPLGWMPRFAPPSCGCLAGAGELVSWYSTCCGPGPGYPSQGVYRIPGSQLVVDDLRAAFELDAARFQASWGVLQAINACAAQTGRGYRSGFPFPSRKGAPFLPAAGFSGRCPHQQRGLPSQSVSPCVAGARLHQEVTLCACAHASTPVSRSPRAVGLAHPVRQRLSSMMAAP